MTPFPKNLIQFLATAIFVLSGTGLSGATTFTGTVISVSGDVAKVKMNGDVMPPNGARAEFFFKIAGGDDEIFVATGSALKIDQGDMLVKVEDASGTVEKGHLVRFSASTTVTSPGSSPIPTDPSDDRASPKSSPPSTATETKAPIIGMWMGGETGDKISLTFRADNTVSYVRLLKGKKKHILRGKYRTDCTVTPCRVEIFEYEVDGVARKGRTLAGLFQIQEFGFREFSMRFDLSEDAQKHPEDGLAKGVVTLIRAKTETPPS